MGFVVAAALTSGCFTAALAWVATAGVRQAVIMAMALGLFGVHRWGARLTAPPQMNVDADVEAADPVASVTVPGDPIGVVPALPPQPGQLLAGRYRLRQLLGAGGMGFVFSALDEAERQTVALKVLRPELSYNPRWAERMEREVRVARTIRHPHVCRVMSFDRFDGHCFLTMELATGGNLSRELRARGARKSWGDRLGDVRAIVQGLAAVHEAGVVHRDLTPQNILRFAGGRLAIGDFGLAVDQPARTTLAAGTPGYMAPEIVAGRKAGCASDVWQLGVIMHEVLFGRRPKPEAPPPATLDPSQHGMYALCAACLEEDPARRPADARVVARAFARREAQGC